VVHRPTRRGHAPGFPGATLLIYGMVFLLPGDPVAALGGDRPLSPAVAAQLRAQYHLTIRFWLQYLHYLGGILHGELGRATPAAGQFCAGPSISGHLQVGVDRAGGGGVCSVSGFGVIAGLRQGGAFDAGVLIVSLIIIAIPIFVLGFLGQFVFGGPVGHRRGHGGRSGDVRATAAARHRAGFGVICLRGAVDPVRGGRQRPRRLRAHRHRQRLSRPRVVTVHILRNSLIPVVTFLGADLGALMGGAIVTEGIFNIHGVGGGALSSRHSSGSADGGCRS